MDVIITSNSPGELATWVAPVVARWRERHPDWNYCLALVPCPFASGRELEYARQIPGLSEIWTPRQTLKMILGGRLLRAKAERGLVAYLGGDPWHAWALARRWGYPRVAYATHGNMLWRYFARVGTLRLELAQKLQEKGVPAKHVGYLGLELPAPSVEEDGPVTIGLFPGSRPLLLRFTLAPFLEIARSLQEKLPHIRQILAVSPFVNREILEDALAHPGYCGVKRGRGTFEGNALHIENGPTIEVVWGDSLHVLRRIHGAIAIPGTTTGEIAAAGKALVVGLSCNLAIPRGGLGWILEHLPGLKKFQERQHMNYYKRQRFAVQPNRWAQEMIVPEVMVKDDLEVLVREAATLFSDRQRCLAMGERLVQIMGNPSEAVRKLADYLVEGLENA